MHETTGTGIASWLDGLGLGEYAQIFADHAIGFDTLPRLSNDDLKELGIRLGHRKPLLAAIAALKRPPATHILPGVLASPDATVERRQLTVMFCDLVGSTEFSSRLDPEDLRDLILLYQQTCADIVARHDGFIAQYRGDGVMIYFGYPYAYEDAAERAVRAGLNLVRAFSALDAPDGNELQVRIGLATGLVVVGDIVGKGASEHTAVAGQVPNLAARVQALAEPDTVAIADSTRRLVGGLFEYADLGLQRLKGIDREIRVWQVLGESDVDVRYDALRSGTADTFVNRDKELAHLSECWEQAQQGRGQIVLLTGEAGIGKSSTLRRLADRVAPDTFRIRLQCSPRHADTPLYPLVSNLQRAAHFVPGDTAAEKLGKLEKILPADSTSRGVPLLAALLSIPCDDRYPALGLPPDRQKALTLKLLVEQLIRLAERRPVLLQVEDAHWIDPTTAEMAWHLVDVLASKRVLVVVTARPEYQPGWTDRPHVWCLRLGRLETAHVHDLIDRVVGGRRFPDHVTQQIVMKTDGVPLFVEELTKTVLESGILSGVNDGIIASEVIIPSTLHDSLMARLDRLGSIKAVAQIGAAIGRRFSFSMLARVTGQPQQAVTDALNKLIAAELIYARGTPPQAEYTFKHALVQEAAYESLLHLKRRGLHGQIAEAIESGFPDLVETEPEALAHHWTRADVPGKAARYWLQAGQRALARSANIEAVRHLSNGMRLLDRLPRDAERDWLEFNLQLSLGQASYVVNGPAATETVKAYARAQELVEAVNDPEQRYALLYGIFSGYHFAAKFDLAEEPARRALALATRDSDSGHMCQAHRMLGYINFFRGNLDAAREHFTQLACLYDPDKHAPLAFRYGADSRTAAQGFHAVLDAISGRPESAVAMMESALAYAQKLGHAPTRGWAYAASSFVYFLLQDPLAAIQITTEGERFCERNSVGAWGVQCRIFNAWARARLADATGCADEIRAATADAAMRTALGVPLFHGALADVLLVTGNVSEARRECDAGVAKIDLTGQYVFSSILHEIRGRSFLASAPPDHVEAAACFRRSIAAAQRSGAKLLELRAAVALARLNPDDDKTRQSVADLYGEFGEGFAMPELRQARDIIGLSI